MQINIFIPLLFFNLCAFCSSKITSTNRKEQDTYFQPLQQYYTQLARYNRLKNFDKNYVNQEPVKEKNIVDLEIQFQDKEYLETFFNKTIDYYKNQDVVHNKKDLADKFWQQKHINNVIAFKQNYEKNDLKNVQSTLEQIKLNDKSSESYNTILQKLIDEEINPLTETYKESYEYDQKLLFSFQDTNNENLEDINLEKLINHISFNFLKTISCAKNDPKKIDFLNQIYKCGANKYEPLFQNEKPLQNNIHSLLESIIHNNHLFTGLFDYYDDCANKKFPAIIENAVKDNLLNDVLQYYRKQLNFYVETTPEQELQKIQHNAMTIISLNLKPIVQKKFKQKYPNNLSSNDISETITTSIFQKEFQFKDYLTMENLINTIIDNLEFPVNQDSIVNLINIFHTNPNGQDTSFEKKESIQSQSLKKDAIKDQIIDPKDLEDVEYRSNSEESLQKNKNNGFRLGGEQQSSILIPKEKNTEIFKKSSKAKLERSTSENNISKKRLKTKSTPQLSSNTPHAKALVSKVEMKDSKNSDSSINNAKKSSPHSSFKTPRVILFTILTLASFWFVVTIFKKLYRFVR